MSDSNTEIDTKQNENTERHTPEMSPPPSNNSNTQFEEEKDNIEEVDETKENLIVLTKQKKKERSFKPVGIYSKCKISHSISLPITAIGKNLNETIEKNIRQIYEGKCSAEGYIKPNSITIITTSSGLIKGDLVIFEVAFDCEVCFPVEGMRISCVAKNITKAGIRAESATETPSPIVVFIARDHHYAIDYFSEINEGDKFTARVIGQRFELNDKYISVIAELLKPKQEFKPKKAKLVIEK